MTSELIAPGGGAAQPALSFGGLLRQLRTQARLTQEELAEVARLSPRSVSDLERGISRTARKDTAGLLAEALSLTGTAREVFVAAARGHSPAADVLTACSGAPPVSFAAPATKGLPSDLASVTDHRSELEYALGMLARAVAGSVVVVIHATIEPEYAIPAAPVRPAPRPVSTTAPARGGNVHRARKRRPESR
jgi:transcriptional regulator with XRE-family HTH domain